MAMLDDEAQTCPQCGANLAAGGTNQATLARGVPEVSFHAAGSYSWISPPSRSRRRNPPRIGPPFGSASTDGTGAM
jgi:hypothetical protein